MKSKYKKSEAGVIPFNWEVKTLGEIASLKRGRFSARPRNDPKYYGGKIPFLQTGDISRSRVNILKFSQTLNSKGLKVSRLFPAGTLFLTIAANIGDVAIANFKTACPDSLVAIHPKANVNKFWLLYELILRKKKIESLATLSAQLNINLEKLNPYILPVPPKAEQDRIVEVISDTDLLLDRLDQTILKKQNIKKALMQELLNGKKRLSGFTNKWKKKQLDEILIYEQPTKYLVENTNYNDMFDIPVLTAGKTFYLGYTNEKNGIYKNLPAIIFDDFTTVTKYVNFEFKVKSSAMKILTLRNKSSNLEFIYQLMQMIQFKVGEHKRHWISEYSKIEVNIPDKEEQDAIANVLLSMQKEIKTLIENRDKVHKLKLSIMQELLSGKTRLAQSDLIHA